MNTRIKQLRLLLNLTQEEFGKKIGVTRSAISYLESGRSSLTEHMLFMICLIFNVNKNWLRDGTGEMFITYTLSEELAAYMGRISGEANPEKEKIALMALKLIVDDWDLISCNIEKIKQILAWINEKSIESQMP